MPDNILFYCLFISQILLISAYFPQKVAQRIHYILNKYPPRAYPKLYTEPLERYQKSVRHFNIMNRFIVVTGFILLCAVAVWDSGHNTKQVHAEGMPLFFGMCQFFPFLLLELSGFKQFRLMRKTALPTTRTAPLHPRRLLDFVSPFMLAIALLMYGAYILVELYLPEWQFHWDNGVLIRVVTISVCNLLFVVIISWNLYGKKLNPHQAHKDRIRQIDYAVKALVFLSIIMSMLFMITRVVAVFDLDYLKLPLNSLYFQLIAGISIGSLLRSQRIEDIDFEGYKAE